MGKYKELDDPVEEVYRIRESIMKEFNYDPKAYNKYFREVVEPKMKKAGCKFVTLENIGKKSFYAQ
ncbi:MAG: hypothetical protein FWF51_11575 [Chitinivibrionia bacterium]|nr:hypothetical protein [Chitinivibrionia bacterium]